jgi:hypothetical protein
VQTELDQLAADPPEAVVVDLGQHPERALAIATEVRKLPRVFVGGEPADVELVRASLPDARFSDWDGIGTILRTALERPPN